MIERFQPRYTDVDDPIACTPPVESPVGIAHFCVTDTDRQDIDGKQRRFMVSVFYPAGSTEGDQARLTDILEPRCAATLEILTADLADPVERTDLVASLRSVALQALRDAPLMPGDNRHPILLYYPAGQAARLSNAALCEQMATRGYIVFALDAPRDSPVVVYPDGAIVTPPMAENESYIDPRVADVRFLLDEIGNLDEKGSLFEARLDLDRIGMCGASRGGYLSNICAVMDHRIKAAANMDGFLWGFATHGTGLSKYSEDFQARARSMTTPILRLIADEGSFDESENRFWIERLDFGGLFFFGHITGATHAYFSTTSFIHCKPVRAIELLQELTTTPPSVPTFVELIKVFFAATLEGSGTQKFRWPDFHGRLYEWSAITGESNLPWW